MVGSSSSGVGAGIVMVAGLSSVNHTLRGFVACETPPTITQDNRYLLTRRGTDGFAGSIKHC